MPSNAYYMSVAKAVAGGSKDPSTKVGAIIVDTGGRIVATGFNGFPPGINDDARLYDRKQKYPLVVHAEVNAVLQAGIAQCRGGTLYVYGIPPCESCAPIIVASGVSNIVFMIDSEKSETRQRWLDGAAKSALLFQEAGVLYVEIDEEFPLTDITVEGI